MQVTGMLYGSKLLQFAGFPAAEVLGPDASEEQIKALIDRHGSVFVKPVFKGGVGKKGKAGLLGRAKDLKTALNEKGEMMKGVGDQPNEHDILTGSQPDGRASRCIRRRSSGERAPEPARTCTRTLSRGRDPRSRPGCPCP